MRPKFVYSAVVIILCFSAVLTLRLTSPQAEEKIRAVPLKIGVVDLSDVVEKYVGRGKGEEGLKKIIDNENVKTKSLQDQIIGLRASIKENAETTHATAPRMIRLRNELEILQLRLKLHYNATKMLLEQGKVKILKNIFVDFTMQLKIYSEKYGYDFVIANNPPSLTSLSTDYENLMLQVSTQPLFYYKNKHNITQEIVAAMNKAFMDANPEEVIPPKVGPEQPVQPEPGN